MTRQVGYRERFKVAYELFGAAAATGINWQQATAEHIAGPLGRVIDPGYAGDALIDIPDDPSWILPP